MKQIGRMSRRMFLERSSAGLGIGTVASATRVSADPVQPGRNLPRQIQAATMSMQDLEGRTSEQADNRCCSSIN